MPNNSKFTEMALEAVNSKLDEIADFIFSTSQDNIVIQGISDQGILLQSGNVEREFLHKKIVYSAAHSKPIEFGSEPHMPPVKPLKGWSKRKLRKTGKEINSVAWAVAMKIKKEGTNPQPFLRPALEQAVVKYG